VLCGWRAVARRRGAFRWAVVVAVQSWFRQTAAARNHRRQVVDAEVTFLQRPSDWAAVVGWAALIGFLAIPLHELGHVIGYRLVGIPATMSYAREIIPAGQSPRFLGVAGGPLLTQVVCYGALLLIYRRTWLSCAYPLAVVTSLDRAVLYATQWRQLLVLHRVSPGMDETRMATLLGVNRFVAYIVFSLLFIVAWFLLVKSLRYGRLKSTALCLIPVAMFLAMAAFGVLVVERYAFPDQFHIQFG
jgi:hypothetical protein